MTTRAERRRLTREAQSLVGELRRELALDVEEGTAKKQDWLNAVEMTGYYYEYVFPHEERPIFGVYEDFQHTDLRALLLCDGDEVRPFVPA